MEAAIVLLLRLLAPLAILKWPLGGGILALLLDVNDSNLARLLGLDAPLVFGDLYQPVDKSLDIYYLTLELWVSRRWLDTLAQSAAKYLYLWRLCGFILFAVTQVKVVFVFFPNIFEGFYLLYLLIKKCRPYLTLTPQRLVLMLLIAGLPKIGHEYVVHVLNLAPYVELRNNLWELLRQ